MEKEKIVSIEDRIPKLKQARKKKANRRLLFYLSIFFLLISLIVYLQSPLSQVKHIQISGNKVLADDEILLNSSLSIGNNIWMMNRQQIADEFEKHPIIKNAEVIRDFPQTVNVKVDEFHVIGYVEKSNSYYPVLENGKVLIDESIANKGNGPLLHHFTEPDYLKRLAVELHEIPDDIFNLISEISWEPTEKNKYKIVLYMNDGFVVQATIRNFASKMKTYPSIISQLDDGDIGIIHMGVGTYFEKFTK